MTDSELDALDLAVAKAEGMVSADGVWLVSPEPPYRPTRDHAEVLRLLQLHDLELRRLGDWQCGYFDYNGDAACSEVLGVGETPCIAICKAVVALAAAAPPPENRLTLEKLQRALEQMREKGLKGMKFGEWPEPPA